MNSSKGARVPSLNTQEVAGLVAAEEAKEDYLRIQVPLGINPLAMGDLSVNSSFQTDINTLVQLGERAKYHEAKRDELLEIQQSLAED